MKKLILLPLLLCLLGCNSSTYKENENEYVLSQNLRVICEHTDIAASTCYCRDIDTDIIYIYFASNYKGGISPYYNSKGVPMTYSEFKTIHVQKYHK